ncbi:unnamed protein product [Toxocara canis]|uniref:Nucleoporin NUP35 n=1 Tax=Toxocara canis TaxID=6265 RepID=A0A183UUR9_TOXCA|nr:unnamed protein product [Toxocara canis]
MLRSQSGREGVSDGPTMFFDSPSTNTAFGGFDSNPTLQHQPTAPNFLFGSANKRRSLAIPPTRSYQGVDSSGWVSQDDSVLFASTVPNPLTPSSSVNKSVHWSPALVHVEGIPPRSSAISLDASRSSPASYRAGPPLRSIRDELKMTSLNSPVTNVTTEPESSTGIPMEQSPVRDNDDGALYWVTVFGFAAEDASQVLQLFSRHGTIVAHRFPERGNWVYIRYSSVIHAQQALSRNGRILEGRLRLGVIPIDRHELASLGEIAKMDVSLGSEENAVMRGSSSLTPSNMRSPCGEGYSSGLSGLNSMGSPDVSSYRLMSASATRPTMRSLSAAYNAADSQFSVRFRFISRSSKTYKILTDLEEL